jgi:hypothetical protein
LLLGAIAVVAAARPSIAELQLKLDSEGLRVEGVTPGGELALLSVWHEVVLDGPHSRQTTIQEVLTDDDGDGVVEFEADREVAIPSIWGVVDTKTGDSAVIVPEGFTLRTIQEGKDAAFGKQLGRLVVLRGELQVLVVRPDVGKWRGRVRDGGQGDVDGRTDRGVTLNLDALEAEQPGDHGPQVIVGDTVLAIDPVQMEVLNLRLQ